MQLLATTGRRGLVGLVSAAILIPGSIEFADRDVATWSHAALHRPAAFEWLTHIVDPLLPASILIVALAGLAALFGWRPGPAARAVLACGIAVLVAVALKDQLKFAFGRTWPETWVDNNPSWIDTGTFGFWPFHKGPGWASFPSGHTTVISAPMAVLWNAAPRFRIVWLALPLLVAIGLIASDYHFLGDIIAGAYLGTACGLGVAALLRRPE